MIPRGILYISYKELFPGFCYCIIDWFKPNKTKVIGPTDNRLVCLSVRSGFDLVLSVLDFKIGSEILVADINIPDMFKIIARHNLTAVPLPVNKQTLNISPQQVEAAITPLTKAILITHLFGGIMETDEIIAIAQKHNLMIFEDCAQAYAGNMYDGNPESDVVMFSYGFIKKNTAVSGATIKIKNSVLFKNIYDLSEQFSRQATAVYFRKVCKVSFVKLLTEKAIYTVFYNLVVAIGKDFDAVLDGFTKGFPGDDIFKQIRYRPCLPNEKLLRKKIKDFDEQCIISRMRLANDILENIPDGYKIGGLNRKNTYWVIPVEISDPDNLISYLRSNGFDASQKASSLIRLTEPENISKTEELTLENLVYLPAYPAMDKKQRTKLVQLLVNYQDRL